MSRAHDIEAQAAEWLMRREQPEWSSADQAALAKWLEESLSHKAAFWRLEQGWRMADRIGAIGEAADVPAQPLLERRGNRVRIWQTTALAASLLMVLAFLGWRYYAPAWFARPSVAAFDTSIGEHRVVPLADGSEVELNTATILRAQISQQRREVWLDSGEAFFNVTHIAGSDFVVHAGPRTITVVGTKFSVRRDGNKVTVSVVEGRVRVEDAAHGETRATTTVVPGDVAIGLGPSMMVISKPVAAVVDDLAWRDGRLVFDRTSLADVASDFNRYNRRQLFIDDPSAAAIRISGTFKASNVDAFVRLLKEAYGLKVESTMDGKLKISS
jgi:transmembrane sensor